MQRESVLLDVTEFSDLVFRCTTRFGSFFGLAKGGQPALEIRTEDATVSEGYEQQTLAISITRTLGQQAPLGQILGSFADRKPATYPNLEQSQTHAQSELEMFVREERMRLRCDELFARTAQVTHRRSQVLGTHPDCRPMVPLGAVARVACLVPVVRK